MFAWKNSEQATDTAQTSQPLLIYGMFAPTVNNRTKNQVLLLDPSLAFVLCAEVSYSYPGNTKWDKIRVIAALSSRVSVVSMSWLM
jgi:hypothetical protein